MKGYRIISSAEQIFIRHLKTHLHSVFFVSSYTMILTKVEDEKLQWVKWFEGKQKNKKIREAECQGKEAWLGQKVVWQSLIILVMFDAFLP